MNSRFAKVNTSTLKIVEIVETNNVEDLFKQHGIGIFWKDVTNSDAQVGYIFDRSTNSFLKPNPTLEEAQAEKKAELKAERDRLEMEPINVKGYTFDFDDKAKDRIQIAKTALETGGKIEWTLADNSTVIVNAKDMQDVLEAVAVRSNALHKHYRILADKVLVCKTVEQVQAIHWE